MKQTTIDISTMGRGFTDLTSHIARWVEQQGGGAGLCHVFLQHTSASLIFCENADPSVRVDLETHFGHLVPDGHPSYTHDYEGDDDMAAHLRTVLTQNSLSVPVSKGRLLLGTWQGIYLWEHRYAGHRRSVILTLQT